MSMPELAEAHAHADVKLVERKLSVDLYSFGELDRRYYHRVVQVVLGVVRDRILAEDMVQDLCSRTEGASPAEGARALFILGFAESRSTARSRTGAE